MPERTILQIRNISTETVERMKQAAGARGWTYATYVERLVQMHQAMLRDNASGEYASDPEWYLTLTGLQEVRA